VTYVHLMLEAHQIIFGEGVPFESFDPRPVDARHFGENRPLSPRLRIATAYV
jgi:hypothetical protein